MAQPRYRILREYANGVMDQLGKFFPFDMAVATIPADAHVRWYVDKISITSTRPINTAAGVDKVEMVIKGVTVVVAQNNVGVIAAAADGSANYATDFDVGLLGDLNTPVTVTLGLTTGLAMIKYAHIDEMVGEYQG